MRVQDCPACGQKEPARPCELGKVGFGEVGEGENDDFHRDG